MGKLLSIFTTAAPIGVATRDIVVIIGAVLSMLGILGVLTPEEISQLRAIVDDITGNWPAIMASVGVITTAGMSVYRILRKSSSDKAAEAAKKIDAQVPKEASVVIKTPAGKPDIVVHAE